MFENVWILLQIFAAFIITIIIAYYLNGLHFGKKLPPGPISFPLVGYFPALIKNPYFKFVKLSKTYGNIFSIRIGSRLAVVLNNGEMIREAFSKSEFLGRPDLPILSFHNIKFPFFSSGKIWSEHRRFTLHALRDLGFGKSKIQELVQDEIRCILECIQEGVDKPFSIKPLLSSSMSNNIASLVFGKRYDYQDPERIFLNNQLLTGNRILGKSIIFICFPWVLYFPFRLIFNFAGALGKVETIISFFTDKIEEHKKTLDDNNARDFIDCYLIEKKKRVIKDPDTTFSEICLPGIGLNLFGAGSNTVRGSVEWCMYIMAAYPEVQKRIQSEIDDVVGSERLPEINDQKSMPYTQATLQEIQRWRTIVPLNLLRITTNDAEVAGYDIPKGTLIFSNLMATHYDPKCWDQPELFKPERFLGEDGKTILKNDNYMPFSYGKRSCPGEGFAILEVFLYMTSILQRFLIKSVNDKPIDLEGEIHFAYEATPQELLFIPRGKQ